MIANIVQHSVDIDLLPIKANILDIGCRGFKLTEYFNKYHNVYSVDIGKLSGKYMTEYYRIAITNRNGDIGVYNDHRPAATHVIEGNEIRSMTLDTFSEYVGVSYWHLIVMDIEDSEYDVLKEAKHPIARQVSVEFHAHLGRSKKELDELLEMLSEFYIIHNQVWEKAQCSDYNYWDILLIAKDE